MSNHYNPNHSSKKIENKYHSMWIENGILMQVYNPQLKRMTLEIAKSFVSDRVSLSKGRKYPCLTHSNGVVKMDDDAKKYISGREAHYLVSAFALIVSNPFAKLLGNFFLKFERITVPAKLFTNKHKALGWIKQFRNLN